MVLLTVPSTDPGVAAATAATPAAAQATVATLLQAISPGAHTAPTPTSDQTRLEGEMGAVGVQGMVVHQAARRDRVLGTGQGTGMGVRQGVGGMGRVQDGDMGVQAGGGGRLHLRELLAPLHG